MNKPTLYKIYDAAGQLLYVGASINFTQRLSTHARTQPWWDEATTIKLEHFDTAEELLSMEKAVIQVEGPKHNEVHLVTRPYKPYRPRGDGALYRRKLDGLWVGRVELPRGRDGKRKYRTVSSKDRKIAELKLAALKAEVDAN